MYLLCDVVNDFLQCIQFCHVGYNRSSALIILSEQRDSVTLDKYHVQASVGAFLFFTSDGITSKQ